MNYSKKPREKSPENWPEQRMETRQRTSHQRIAQRMFVNASPLNLFKMDQGAWLWGNLKPTKKRSLPTLWQYTTSPRTDISSFTGITSACSPCCQAQVECTRTPWALMLSV